MLNTRQLDFPSTKITFRSVQNSARLPFLELYFAAVLSLVFCIFRTFLTIFCSSTKKARMILHRVVVTHKTTKMTDPGLNISTSIYSPLPNSNSREYSTIRTVHSPAVPRQPRPFVLSRPQVRDLEIWEQYIRLKNSRQMNSSDSLDLFRQGN